jgi:hypothetical protein
LQQSRRANRAWRALAVVASAWLLISGVLGRSHEARVAHVVDPHTGELRHASAMVGTHSGTHSDYHAASDRDADTAVCPLVAALHQAVDVGAAQSAALIPPTVEHALPFPRTTVATVTSVYRLAPKTSPPARA